MHYCVGKPGTALPNGVTLDKGYPLAVSNLSFYAIARQSCTMPRHKVSIENSKQVERTANQITPFDVTSLSFNEQLTIILDTITSDDETPAGPGDSTTGAPSDTNEVEQWINRDGPFS